MSLLDFTAEARERQEADAVRLSDLTATDPGPEDSSMTQQNMRDEVDINTIMRRFGVTRAQQIPVDVGRWVYGDFSGVTDYESAREQIERADVAFMALPPEVRELFGNDPGRMVYAASSLPESEFLALFDRPAGGAAADVPPAVPVVVP